MTENSISSEQILENLRKNLSAINATVDKQEASVVIEVGDGIAHVSGLKSAMAGELLKFSSSSTGRDVYGLAQNLDADEVGAVLFGNVEDVKEGDESWISPWATPCSAESSTPSASPSTASVRS